MKLVLVPGLLCDFRLWQHQIAEFSNEYEIIVGDTFRDDSIAGMASRIIEQADGQEFALAGLSMGGYVALEIVRQAQSKVRGLALLDTSARPDDEVQKRRRRGLINLAGRGQFFGVTPRLLPMLIHPTQLENMELTDLIVGMAAHVGKERFVSQQTAIMNRADSRSNLKDIDCPTIVICGQEDEITPPELAEEMSGEIPQSRLHLIETCGHLTCLEKPFETNMHIRNWLQEI